MGYDIHITRREYWAASEGSAITREEWDSILAGDAELEPLNDGEAAQMVNPWRSAARFFFYWRGSIIVKKPNRAVLMKMLFIAEKLGARVVGDNDEVYSTDGTPSKDVSHWFVLEDRW